ncbi:Hypothetical protein PHPALM_8348 [Phytophthora palmivora]|uniref:Uncharacterized protein n=1 Tax=Phytophthora palmivora TaxID=4796 RepID=A0A2P4YA27_9STRA|nr:Hypothetical protein PHPALM_8348 [Phytophthora palmivora]
MNEGLELSATELDWRKQVRRTEWTLTKKKNLATKMTSRHMWNEPGLWQFPDKCCYWIWEDPRAEELGGPTCESLDLQLATLDMREPARVQWSTVIDDEEWLQYVPNYVKRHVKPVAIRKLNPLSLTHS